MLLVLGNLSLVNPCAISSYESVSVMAFVVAHTIIAPSCDLLGSVTYVGSFACNCILSRCYRCRRSNCYIANFGSGRVGLWLCSKINYKRITSSGSTHASRAGLSTACFASALGVIAQARSVFDSKRILMGLEFKPLVGL